MNSRAILRASLFIIILAACQKLIAQQVAAPAPTPVTTVNLNLIVTDREKHSRDDVNKDEIQVFEDGIPQTISTITKDDKPVNYVIAIDNSASLKNLVAPLLNTAASLINANRDVDETLLMYFSSSEKMDLIENFTSDKSKLIQALKLLRIEGGQSAVVDGIYVAVQSAAQYKVGDSSIRRAVVLVSDGEERASYYSTDQMVKLLRARNVQVFVIGIITELDTESVRTPSQKERAEKLLNRVARETGGRAFFPADGPQLARAIQEINHDLRAQHIISYESKATSSNETFRKIEVKITDSPKGEKMTAITRSGYFINPPDLDGKDKKKKPK